MVGMTYGWPSTTNPTWQIRASSRMASMVSRSYAPRSGSRRTWTRGVMAIVIATILAASQERSVSGVAIVDEFDGFLIDLDGVVYVGDGLVPGSDRAVRALRELGKRVVFLTNDPR